MPGPADAIQKGVHALESGGAEELRDYEVLGGRIMAIDLTPRSGSQNSLKDILKGEYKDWAPLILRTVDLKKFPLKFAILLGLENEFVFFSDEDRSKKGELR